MKEKKWCVYVHENKTNGKKYVGITSMKPKRRWKGGYGYHTQAKFYNAIKKYGWDNFKHSILCECTNEDVAIDLEMLYIKLYDSCDNGYNCAYGSLRRGCVTEDTKRKLSALNSGINHPNYGKKASINVRIALATSNKEREWGFESKKKLSESQKKRFEENQWVVKLIGSQSRERWMDDTYRENIVNKLKITNSGGGNPSARIVMCGLNTFLCIKDFAMHYDVGYISARSWLNPNSGRRMPQKYIDLGLRYATEEDIEEYKNKLSNAS